MRPQPQPAHTTPPLSFHTHTHTLLLVSRPTPGENDVTIILKPVAGAKRWQHLQRQAGAEGALAVESNYTVILGSHRNSKLKIEKNGEERAAVRRTKAGDGGGDWWELGSAWQHCWQL